MNVRWLAVLAVVGTCIVMVAAGWAVTHDDMLTAVAAIPVALCCVAFAVLSFHER